MEDKEMTKSENIEYLSRIKASYKQLSNLEKRVADYLMNNQSNAFEGSINVVAEKIGVSTATITRFCRKVGFKGFNELQFYVERELLSPVGETDQINRTDSVKVLKQKMFNFNKRAIDDTMMVLDDDEVEKAIDVISRARKVNLYGEGGSGSAVMSAYNLFLQIGLPCEAFSDIYLEVMSASLMKKNDVAMGISFSGSSANTIEALRVAKEQGATTICITGIVNSPITKYADISLYISSKESVYLSDLSAARISELSVVGLLQAGILAKNYERYAGNIAKVKDVIKLKKVK